MSSVKSSRQWPSFKYTYLLVDLEDRHIYNVPAIIVHGQLLGLIDEGSSEQQVRAIRSALTQHFRRHLNGYHHRDGRITRLGCYTSKGWYGRRLKNSVPELWIAEPKQPIWKSLLIAILTRLLDLLNKADR